MNDHALPIPNQWVPGTLQTISSKVLKSIQYNIYVRFRAPWDILTKLSGWEDIAQAMNALRLSSVQLIEIRLVSTPRSTSESWLLYVSMGRVKNSLAHLSPRLNITYKEGRNPW